MKFSAFCGLLIAAWLGLSASMILNAAMKPEHKKEVDKIKGDLKKVKALIGKSQFGEAAKIINESEQKLKKVTGDAGVKESDTVIFAAQKLINVARTDLKKKQGVSFSKDVAPILAKSCLNCHGNENPRKGLRMDTFAGLEAGGQGGTLVVVGSPQQSLLIRKLTAPQGRMPPQGDPLKESEIATISLWIDQGAKFDGVDKAAKIGDVADLADDGPKGPVDVAKATGTESVSFVQDIAPFMANLCVGCHSGAQPRAGFSLATFENLMRGGRSGRVVLPGNPADSRLWHLVGEQDPIKMPPGQALITKTNWNNLRTWIEEGAKFDGPDAKAPLRSLVPTEAEKAARDLAAMSLSEVAFKRKERAAELWKDALAKETPIQLETPEFLVYGNATETRIKQVSDWAEEDAKKLRKVFNVSGGQIWKGRLTVFMFKDRFSYEEFARTNEKVEIPGETHGHAKVNSSLTEAYICLEDVGDEGKEGSPGLHVLLFENLTAGLLQRSATKMPDWVIRGTGLALAAAAEPSNAYFPALQASALEQMKTIQNPTDIFNDGTFSSGTLGPVAYTLVTHMLKVAGEPQFVKFLAQIQTGTPLDTSLNSVYTASREQLATSYVSGLSNKSGSKKKK